MCDPISMIGMAISLGTSAMQYSAQQDMARQQENANAQWVAYQRRQSQQFAARDEELRRNAEAARTGSLSELDARKQTGAQENEQARLTEALSPEDLAKTASGDPNTIAGKMLSGQQGGAEEVRAGIQGQIQKAAQEARTRIAALAAVQSYGGSQFGLTNRANAILNASNQDIRMASNQRGGTLQAHQIAKQVEPIKITQTGGQALGGIAQAAAGIAGKGLGSTMAGMMTG
jgi:hypothetical protein